MIRAFARLAPILIFASGCWCSNVALARNPADQANQSAAAKAGPGSSQLSTPIDPKSQATPSEIPPLNIKVTQEDHSTLWEKLLLVLAGAIIGFVGTLIQIRKQVQATERQIETARTTTGAQITAAQQAADRQITALRETTESQIREQQKQNQQETQRLQERLDYQKTQIETQRELVSALRAQAEILEATLAHMRIDVFTKTYGIVYSELSMRCASMLRAVVDSDAWDQRLLYYSQGHRDSFANALKNKIRHLGSQVFKERFLNFFSDDSALLLFCERFEAFLVSADESDPSNSLRTSLESSGLAFAYIAICGVLERNCALKFRKGVLSEREDRVDETGMPLKGS